MKSHAQVIAVAVSRPVDGLWKSGLRVALKLRLVTGVCGVSPGLSAGCLEAPGPLHHLFRAWDIDVAPGRRRLRANPDPCGPGSRLELH